MTEKEERERELVELLKEYNELFGEMILLQTQIFTLLKIMMKDKVPKWIKDKRKPQKQDEERKEPSYRC